MYRVKLEHFHVMYRFQYVHCDTLTFMDYTSTHDVVPMSAAQQRFVDIKGALTLMHVSRTTLYALLRDGKIPRVKVGTRTLLKVDDIYAFLDEAHQASSFQPHHL